MQNWTLIKEAKLKSIKFRPILPPRPTLLLVSFQSYGLCKLNLFPSSELGTTAASENFRHMSRSTFPTQPTQLFSIVLALIYSRYSPEGPGHPTGGAGGAHGGRWGHQDGHQDGHQEHLWGVEWVIGTFVYVRVCVFVFVYLRRLAGWSTSVIDGGGWDFAALNL